jgi:hypothetical protein
MISTDQEPRLSPADGNALKVRFFQDFRIEGTSLGDGSCWRVTTIHETVGVKHEFFVHSGQIYHVQFHTPAPWSHLTRFVVGHRVKRILASEKKAILAAVAGW